jgi:8-amino-7-oxononanoate synthase
MDGDIAPLAELHQLATACNGVMVVDDAHGFGVVGDQGRGSLAAIGLSPRNNILMMGTLGKALGSFGAFVAGDALYIDHLIQIARSYVYTTALPPSVVAAALCGIQLLRSNEWELPQRLQRNINYFRAAASAAGLSVLPSTTAIQPLIIGDPQRSLSISKALRRDGFLVVAIRPPTVAVGTSRLRITLSAKHELSDIDDLVASLTAAQLS